jgi:hypothetical protein
VTAIRNVTVVPVVGTIRNSTVVIRGGDRVGRREVAVPAGAITGRGFLYPGMIDSHTQLGLTEIQSVPGGNDTREIGDFNPQNLALSAVNPHSELIPVTRVNGVTSAITAAEGGLVSGYAALMDLAGWTTAEMGVAPRAGMVVTYPRVAGGRFGGRRGGSQEDAGAQVNRQVTQLVDYFRRAREYRDAKQRSPPQRGPGRTSGRRDGGDNPGCWTGRCGGVRRRDRRPDPRALAVATRSSSPIIRGGAGGVAAGGRTGAPEGAGHRRLTTESQETTIRTTWCTPTPGSWRSPAW